MAKDTSKGAGGGGVANLQIGDDKIDLTDSPLIYDKKMESMSAAVRKTVEDWENKRVKNKVEYSYCVDANGSVVGGEVRGSKGTVSTPKMWIDASEVHTHIHPRKEGVLGGTFSPGDIETFGKTRQPFMRAAAKEGSYTMKRGTKFDGNGLLNAFSLVANNVTRAAKARGDKAYDEYKKGSRTWESYAKEVDKANNVMLVEMHNWLRQPKNQRAYGYEYALERR